MKKVSRLLLLVSLACLFHPGSSLQADCRETTLLENANVVLSEFTTMFGNWIPMAVLQNAQGVAIFPRVIKAAVGVGGRHGRGVLLIRGADGSWGPPVFLTLSGASAGIQLGVERSDLVIVLRTRRDLECIKKGKLTLGLGAALAVGSFGRDKFLNTDLGLKTVLISVSRSKGLFAGNCVLGASLHVDDAANAAYGQYEQDCLRNGGPTGPGVPPSVQLQMKLVELTAPAPEVVAPSRALLPSLLSRKQVGRSDIPAAGRRAVRRCSIDGRADRSAA